MEEKIIRTTFCNAGLPTGKMLSFSKTEYRQANPGHEVYFNANIVTTSKGKIWWGDLDVTIDGPMLEQVARELNEEIYVLRELDGRFENEELSGNELKSKSVWSTKIFN